MKHRCVILSGGMDSATLLHRVFFSEGDDDEERLYTLSFDYGQRHARELICAKLQAEGLRVEHIVHQIPALGLLTPKSALTGSTPVPHGHYMAETMKQTVVPGRNTLFLALALASIEARLQAGDTGVIYYGAHAGDHAIYPDCRRDYVSAMNLAISLATEGRVRLEVPYLEWDKGDILSEGRRYGVQYKNTHTCYAGNEVACGRCGACTERLAGFDKAGFPDPLDYADREFYKLNFA